MLSRQFSLFTNQNDTILFLSQNFECIYIVIRSNHNFKEDFIDLFRCLFINNRIRDQHSPKGRYRITGQRIFPCFEYSRTRSQPASIIMLQNSKCDIVKLIDQIDCGIDVKQVVIRDLFSMNLIEHLIQVSIEISLLMWIFAITQRLLAIGRATESRTLFSIKIVEDSRIIV